MHACVRMRWKGRRIQTSFPATPRMESLILCFPVAHSGAEVVGSSGAPAREVVEPEPAFLKAPGSSFSRQFQLYVDAWRFCPFYIGCSPHVDGDGHHGTHGLEA